MWQHRQLWATRWHVVLEVVSTGSGDVHLLLINKVKHTHDQWGGLKVGAAGSLGTRFPAQQENNIYRYIYVYIYICMHNQSLINSDLSHNNLAWLLSTLQVLASNSLFLCMVSLTGVLKVALHCMPQPTFHASRSWGRKLALTKRQTKYHDFTCVQQKWWSNP